MADYQHGDVRRYRNGCRCTPCRLGGTRRRQEIRHLIATGQWEGRTNPTGSMRRLRALVAIGWCDQYLADALGHRNRSRIYDITSGLCAYLLPTTVHAIADLYEMLHTVDGPDPRAPNRARRNGWHTPDAWSPDTIDDPEAKPYSYEIIDDLAIRWAVAGDRHIAKRLTKTERRIAVKLASSRGMSSADLADLFDVPQRGVTRDRAAMRAAA